MASKTVLILGSSVHPLLLSLTASLAEQHNVLLTLPSTVAAVPAAMLSNTKISVLTLDVSSPPSVTTAARHISSRVSGIDVLVNDAGLGGSLALLYAMRSSSIYEAKISSMADTVLAFADLLERSSGRIVCLGTSAAMISAPCMNSARFSTKEALAHMSTEMRTTLAPWGVPVTSITVDLQPASGQLVVASSRHSTTMHMSGLVTEIMERDGRSSGWTWPRLPWRAVESHESLIEKGVVGLVSS